MEMPKEIACSFCARPRDALVADGGDMTIANMAARIGSMRIRLDR